MKRIISLILSLIMVFSLVACNEDNGNRKERPTNNFTNRYEEDDNEIVYEENNNAVVNEQKVDETVNKENVKTNNRTLTFAGDFSDGVAWVKYKVDYKTENIALIDTKANILYETEAVKTAGGEVIKMQTADGLAFFATEDQKTTLLDKKGNVILTSKDGVFDTVLAVGGGYALVYKYEGPKNEKFVYKILDTSGNVVHTMELFNKPRTAYYFDDNVFFMQHQYGTLDVQGHALINAKTGKYQYIHERSDYSEYRSYKFYDNMAIIPDSYCPVDDPVNHDIGRNTLMRKHIITSDFVITEWNEEYSQYGEAFAKVDFVNKKIEIYNPTSGGAFLVEGYTAPRGILRDKNYYLIHNKYIVLVDSTGKEQFKAFNNIVVDHSTIANGVITFEVEYNGYKFIDYKGNVLAENLQYEDVGEFSKEGLVVAKDSNDRYHYLDKHGNVVI